MAKKSALDLGSIAKGFNDLPLARQILLLVSAAGLVSLVAAAILWIQGANYRPIYNKLNHTDAVAVMDELQKLGIDYKFSERDGTILIPAEDIYLARLKIGALGLPKGQTNGSNFLNQSSGFGTSRFMENAKYKHALEQELARTIQGISGIEAARVHLALPQKSAFIGDDKKPSASVLVNLASGSQLEHEQVSAIVQMVASSITGMNSKDVTVTDQFGQLLTNSKIQGVGLSKEQFNYQKHLEHYYENRIETMLAPLLGKGKVRVRVAADIDFTIKEQTKEEFKPELQALVSEHTVNEQSTEAGGNGGGVPGAVANRPQAGGGAGGQGGGGNSKTQSTKNYENGKHISYVKSQVGELRNLSVAVVIDNKTVIGADGKPGESTPLTKEELEKIQALVQSAIGFDEKRGDKVTVINTAFAPMEKVQPLPPVPFWEKPWFWDTLKISSITLLTLLLLFGFIRPFMYRLATRKTDALEGANAEVINGEHLTPEMYRLKEAQVQSLKKIAAQDASEIANVIKTWVNKEK